MAVCTRVSHAWSYATPLQCALDVVPDNRSRLRSRLVVVDCGNDIVMVGLKSTPNFRRSTQDQSTQDLGLG